MVLLALSAVFSAFGVEVLAFSLVGAEGRVRKAPGLAKGSTLRRKSGFASSQARASGLSRPPSDLRERRAPGVGGHWVSAEPDRVFTSPGRMRRVRSSASPPVPAGTPGRAGSAPTPG